MNWKHLLCWKKKRTDGEGRTPRPEPEEERRLQAELAGLERQLELLDILCEGRTTQSWEQCRKELRRDYREKRAQLKRWKREGLR